MSKREVIKCLIDNHNTEMTVKELTDKIPRANRFTIEKNVRLLRKANQLNYHFETIFVEGGKNYYRILYVNIKDDYLPHVNECLRGYEYEF